LYVPTILERGADYGVGVWTASVFAALNIGHAGQAEI
jgi:hypothetical protein